MAFCWKTILWLIAASCAACYAETDLLSIKAEGTSSGNLKFVIANEGNAPFIIRSRELPWTVAYPYPVTTCVHAIDSRTLRPIDIEQSVILASVEFEEISIEPNTAIDGEIFVRDRFPEINVSNAHLEFYLHWVYTIHRCDEGIGFINFGTARIVGDELTVESQQTSRIAFESECDGGPPKIDTESGAERQAN